MSSCQGNFCTTCEECAHLIGRAYLTEQGDTAILYGIVYAEDGLYYIMDVGGKHTWVSCVITLESAGYTLIP